MPNAVVSELFATKGIEYLLVIGFLLSLTLFWRFLNRPTRAAQRAPAGAWSQAAGRWFGVRTGDYYHPGHAWLRPVGPSRVRVGIDHFAAHLVGRPDAIRLPGEGARIDQGDTGWSLQFGSRSVPMLSPVSGTVVARNDGALRELEHDSHGDGWLLEVETPRMRRTLSNLMTGAVARSWMETTERLLRRRISGELGAVLQDGGLPVSGIARSIAPDDWDTVACEFLLTKDLRT